MGGIFARAGPFRRPLSGADRNPAIHVRDVNLRAAAIHGGAQPVSSRGTPDPTDIGDNAAAEIMRVELSAGRRGQ